MSRLVIWALIRMDHSNLNYIAINFIVFYLIGRLDRLVEPFLFLTDSADEHRCIILGSNRPDTRYQLPEMNCELRSVSLELQKEHIMLQSWNSIIWVN